MDMNRIKWALMMDAIFVGCVAAFLALIVVAGAFAVWLINLIGAAVFFGGILAIIATIIFTIAYNEYDPDDGDTD